MQGTDFITNLFKQASSTFSNYNICSYGSFLSIVMNSSNLEDSLESCVCFIEYKIRKSGLLE